jgi:hypothetical protein
MASCRSSVRRQLSGPCGSLETAGETLAGRGATGWLVYATHAVGGQWWDRFAMLGSSTTSIQSPPGPHDGLDGQRIDGHFSGWIIYKNFGMYLVLFEYCYYMRPRKTHLKHDITIFVSIPIQRDIDSAIAIRWNFRVTDSRIRIMVAKVMIHRYVNSHWYPPPIVGGLL